MKAVVALLLLTVCAFAQDVAIDSVTRIPNQPNSLTVSFDYPAPDESQATDHTRWAAWCLSDKTTTPGKLDVLTATHDDNKSNFHSTPTVILAFSQDVINNCQAAEVIFLVAKFPTGRWAKKSIKDPAGDEPPSFWSLLFAPPDPSKDPNYSLSFTVVPAVGSKPTYTIDGSIHHRIWRHSPNDFHFNAVTKTDSSNKADPDSFNWNLSWLRVTSAPVSLKSNFVGMEFDKNANVMNEISDLGFIWQRLGGKTAASGDLIYSWTFQVNAAVELGDNIKNEFTIANQAPHRGTGFIFRGAPRVRFDFAIPTSNPKHAIIFNSTYTVRLPARDELFLETRHSQDPVPLLGTNPRHYVENNLTFKVTDYFGFKFQHSYGDLPPTFKFVDNKGSIGIVFQAMQAK